MNSGISPRPSTMSRRRLAGAALAAALWSPVYAPGMMLWGNIVARVAPVQPSSLGFALYIAFFALLAFHWLVPALNARLGRPQVRSYLFEVDRIFADDSLDTGEKLRAVRATSLGRFLVIYAALFVVLCGLALVV